MCKCIYSNLKSILKINPPSFKLMESMRSQTIISECLKRVSGGNPLKLINHNYYYFFKFLFRKMLTYVLNYIHFKNILVIDLVWFNVLAIPLRSD